MRGERREARSEKPGVSEISDDLCRSITFLGNYTQSFITFLDSNRQGCIARVPASDCQF